ncbi:MAG: hypothetical protein LBJ47_11715 [Tannerella sp.]|nr:hypothetical protein [Tannerella sp.]
MTGRFYSTCSAGRYPAERHGLQACASEIIRPVRDGMSVENAGYLLNSVPSGTECGDCHIAYLTARGRGVAVAFSTNILSRRDRETITCYCNSQVELGWIASAPGFSVELYPL